MHRDIVKGLVNEEHVALIVTGTKRDFESEPDWSQMNLGIKEINPAIEILDRLWKQGRIHQPRRVSSAYEDDRTASVLPSYAKHWFKLSPEMED